MGKIKICDAGAYMLSAGIVRQAVNDYCNQVEKLVDLLTVNNIDSLLADVKHGMKKIEEFFKSDWCAELCPFDGDYLIKTTKQKAIDDMVNLCIAKFKILNGMKNKKSKTYIIKREETIEYYNKLRLFLESSYLEEFTETTCEYYLQKIEKDSKCNICDLM